MNNFRNFYGAFKAIRNRASGKNASLWRLIYQFTPYLLSHGGYARPPINLWLSINTSCNLRCNMCDIGQKIPETSFYKNIGSEKGQELPVETVVQIAEDLAPYKVNVHICCVEPLLYSHLYEATRAFVERGMTVDLTTNGLLLDKKAEEVMAAGFRNIWVSLDGPPKIHDSIRGVPGTFERAMNGIRKIELMRKEKGVKFPRFSFLCVITQHNQGHLKEFADTVQEIDYERILFAHMNFVSQKIADLHNKKFEFLFHATETNMSKVDPMKVDIDIVYDELQYVSKNYRNISFSPFLSKKEMETYYYHHTEFVKRSRCFIPWGAVQINADGDVIIFSRCMNLTMGNVHKQPIMEIWNGEKMREFRRLLRKNGAFPFCLRCSGVA